MGWPGPAGDFPVPPAKEQELGALKQQLQSLEQILDELKRRIAGLDKSTPERDPKTSDE